MKNAKDTEKNFFVKRHGQARATGLSHRMTVVAALLLALTLALDGCGSSGSENRAWSTSGGSAHESSDTAEQGTGDAVDTADEAQTKEEEVVYPEWIYYDDFYTDTYMALIEKYSRFELSRLFSWNSKDLCPLLGFDQSDEVLKDMKQTLAPVFAGRDIPMLSMDFTSGGMEEFTRAMDFFSEMDYASLCLKLNTSFIQDTSAMLEGLSSLPRLRTLCLERFGFASKYYWDELPEEAEDLILYIGGFHSHIPAAHKDVDNCLPNLKKLTLIVTDNGLSSGVSTLSVLSPLEELWLYDEDGNELEVTSQMAEAMLTLKTLENIVRINGVERDTYVPVFSDNEAAAAYGASEDSYALQQWFEEVKSINYTQGTPHVGDKVLVSHSWTSATHPAYEPSYKDYPQERLTEDLGEADTLLFLYAVTEEAGWWYTNGASAIRTYTMVATVDLKDGTIDTCVIGVTEPPETVTMSSTTRHVYGDTLGEEAFTYALGLF